MQKSIYLNQKTPAYSTRTHPGCIAFKAKLQKETEKEQFSKQITQKSINFIEQRISWIKRAWQAEIDRTIDNKLFPNFKKITPKPCEL